MREQTTAVVCAAAFLFLFPANAGAKAAAATATTVRVGSSGAASKDRLIYSSIKDLMDSIIDPSADVLWGAGGTVVDREGIHDLSPKTPEAWRDVRRASVRIIEGANLLTMPRRDAAPAGTKSETPGVELEPAQITALIRKNRKSFDAFAKALQRIGLEALRASDAQNTALLLDVGARMDNVCESCHQTFWYPEPSPSRSAGK